MSGNSKEAYNTLKALTRTQQHASAVLEDSSGNILTESTAVLSRWIEFCGGLYNYELRPNTILLQSKTTKRAESLPVLREEAEEAMRSQKAEKVSWSGQHFLWAAEQWRWGNHNCPDSDM